MISRDLVLTVANNKATLSEPITLYKNDRGVVLNLEIKGYKYKFNRKTEYNLLRNSEVGIVGARVLVLKPDQTYFEIPMAQIENDIVKVVIGQEWTDEDVEIGTYKLQIQLYGEDHLNQRITIPPVEFKVESLIADINEVQAAIAGAALVDKSIITEEGETDNSDLANGVYDKTVWTTGDVITSHSLNKIENAVDHSITELHSHSHSYNDLTDKPTLLKGDKGDKGDRGDSGVYVGDVDSAPLDAYIVIDDSDLGLFSNDLVSAEITNGVLNLTTHRNQFVNMENNTEIVLPTVDKYTEIHLFFNTTEELTLTLPSVKWQIEPALDVNKTYEFIFTYANEWLGGCVVYA